MQHSQLLEVEVKLINFWGFYQKRILRIDWRHQTLELDNLRKRETLVYPLSGLLLKFIELFKIYFIFINYFY